MLFPEGGLRGRLEHREGVRQRFATLARSLDMPGFQAWNSNDVTLNHERVFGQASSRVTSPRLGQALGRTPRAAAHKREGCWCPGSACGRLPPTDAPGRGI